MHSHAGAWERDMTNYRHSYESRNPFIHSTTGEVERNNNRHSARSEEELRNLRKNRQKGFSSELQDSATARRMTSFVW